MRNTRQLLTAFLCFVFILTACSKTTPANKVVVESPEMSPTVIAPEYDPEWDKGVTLTESTITWLTYDYEVDQNHSAKLSSFDGKTIVAREFKLISLKTNT